MKCIRGIAMLLIIIGALNWGLVGFFQYDLIADFFGGSSASLARLIYDVIGISGILGLFYFFRRCCGGCKSSCQCGSSSCQCSKKDRQ